MKLSADMTKDDQMGLIIDMLGSLYISEFGVKAFVKLFKERGKITSMELDKEGK